jgi:hypothetical protein
MVLQKIIKQDGVYYFDDPHEIYTNWHYDPAKVELLKKHQLIVADFSSEHYGQDTLHILYNQLESSGLNFLLLSHDINDHLVRPRMLFYPHWYYWSLAHLLDATDTTNRTYTMSCLNGNPRPHRIYNYLQLTKQPYYTQSLVTMHSAENLFRGDDVELDSNIINEWSQIVSTLRDRNTVLIPGSARRLDNPAYADSYIHLSTETTVVPKIFVTEKTWKPIAAGQFFLVQGNPNTIDYLRNQGVDVFDDIIDHKYYDSETDWRVRTDRIHEIITNLASQNLEQLYIQTANRRNLNKQKFFNGEFDHGYQQQILKCINTQN